MSDIDTDGDRVINRKVRDIQTGRPGVILDPNDKGRVKVLFIDGSKSTRFYDRKNAGNVLKPRYTFGR